MGNSRPFSLKQIASWQTENPQAEESDGEYFCARVPSLQRGSAWEPQQVEMLWDSIFRGFPVGSLVLVKRIAGQNDRAPASGASAGVEASHHILDGQQRCNAVALGYLNPDDCKNGNPQILWLDLCWDRDKAKASTRKYLFRLTNKAHPWGFDSTDNSGFLTVSRRREFIEKLEKFKGDEYRNKRPSPQESYPHDATFPVPVYLLFDYFKDGSLDWEGLQKDPKIMAIEKWSGLKVSDFKDGAVEIVNGIKLAEEARIFGLALPDDFAENIEDIEKIFQRLNSQGTPINNEDLSYSMMKAYWPDLDNFMSGINKKPIHESRLAGLGIRVALTEKDSGKLYPVLPVDKIRSVFSGKQGDPEKIMAKIKGYFSEGAGGIQSALDWIDHNLLYREDGDCGIPAYLRSSVAWSSPEVFAWWMWLAKEFSYQELAGNDPLRKRILAYSLIIHWLGLDKPKAVDCLIRQHAAFKSGALTISEIKNDMNQLHVISPLCPEAMKKCFQISEPMTDAQLVNYISLWHGVVAFDESGDKRSTEDQEKAQGLYWEFVNSVCHQREFLVYNQRAEIKRIFEDFDPSDKLMWKGHNRPWDYDHILASNKLNAQGSGYEKYTRSCQAWQKTIGNLIAVDFSFNREAQDKKSPIEKYRGIDMIDDRFDVSLATTADPEKSMDFIVAVSSRLLAIYKAWFDSLEIGELLGKQTLH